MNPSQTALLDDRGVVSVSGEDAGRLLQGLITNDMALLGVQPAIFAGLLSPQGKILFDFIVVKVEGGYLLETAGEYAAGLVKRLQLYKLRANVEIRDVSLQYAVAVTWNELPLKDQGSTPVIAFADPRLAGLGLRSLIPRPADGAIRDGGAIAVSADAYHAHRISLGVPEGGKDYVFGDTFPHEALFDQLNGVSFTKGCFVGQEVVSRMEHRGTVRKRVVPLVGEAPLPSPGSEIRAGEVSLGTLGSVGGSRGLALLRLDRAAEAIAHGVALTAGGAAIRIELPEYATFEFAPSPTSA